MPLSNQVPGLDNDQVVVGRPIGEIGPVRLPNIIFGAGSFSNQYNNDSHLASVTPLLTVRLALRYGIRAFDTSPYYGLSEMILGDALQALKDEFPRSSYQLMSKCGRYGLNNFDYSPATVRKSVKRSLDRLHTSYLDTVYLHDVEFICTPIAPRTTGNHVTALHDDRAGYGLIEGEESTVHGDGDRKILAAYAELQKLKDEGLIKHIGITGYPLPTLLRLALLILHNPPFKPVDVILSYSHLTLQNSTFLAFVPHFYERARVGQLLAASPLSMGLLTTSPPPWHPAPEKLLNAVTTAGVRWSGDLSNLSLGFSFRSTEQIKEGVPFVVGLSNPREVHECVKVWRQILDGEGKAERLEGERLVQDIFEKAGYLDWSWASPPV